MLGRENPERFLSLGNTWAVLCPRMTCGAEVCELCGSRVTVEGVGGSGCPFNMTRREAMRLLLCA